MHLLPLALLLAGTAAYYDTVLEKKCMALKRTAENAAYVNGVCFVALTEAVQTSFDDWPKLHDRCKLINGYRGGLAYIPDRPFLMKLFKSGVLAKKHKYFIGARQFPKITCDDIGGVCTADRQKEGWFFFDEKNNKIGPVIPEIWIDQEPGNSEAPENVAVVESFDSYTGGLNDMNAAKGKYQPLCQFIDYLKCEDGYILIRDKCYKIQIAPATAAESKKKCEADGAVLASIHDDAMNAIIIDYSRDNNRTDANLPIRFGLSHGSEWVNDDGTTVDYFRWWDQAGCGIPTAFTGGNVRAALVVSGKARNPDPSYWIIEQDSKQLPFLCQKNPTKAYDSA